mgnify:CR=1 FL=1
MPNQKLLEALSCFSDKNRKRFREFVRSTFYNNKYNRLKISQLLDYLLALKNNKILTWVDLSKNAGYLAAQMLGVADPAVAQRVADDRRANAEAVIAKDAALQKMLKAR